MVEDPACRRLVASVRVVRNPAVKAAFFRE
jgi:hypothetical protein